MAWKLILTLSIFGLAMGVATVFWIGPNLEPFFWLAIFLISGYAIGRSATRPFLTGVLVGLANYVWITGAHMIFAASYLANHVQEAAMMRSGPLPDSPRLMMAVAGPIVGLISGIVIGLLGLLGSKLARPRRLASN